MKKAVTSILLVLTLLLSPIYTVSAATPGATEMKSIINNLRSEFYEGRYMDDNWLYANYWGTGCWAFGTLVFERIFGIRPKGNIAENWNPSSDLYVGDWLRTDGDGHTVVITDLDISNNRVSYVDCNYGWTNQVHWHDNENLTSLRNRITYIYHMPGNYVQSLSDASVPSQNPWIETWSPEYITENNAKIQGNVRNPSGRYISTVGCSVWDYDGNLVHTHYEPMNSAYHTADSVHMWFDMNSEVGITLWQGTLYKYQMFVIQSDNQAFYGDVVELETNGAYRITWNANGGTVNESGRSIIRGRTYGSLPVPVRGGYQFEGWYTAATGGSQIHSSEKFSATTDQMLYAHWIKKAVVGDVDKNGTINAADALLILKHSVHLITLNKDECSTADVDGNQTINAADALLVLKCSVHLIKSSDFPAVKNL